MIKVMDRPDASIESDISTNVQKQKNLFEENRRLK